MSTKELKVWSSSHPGPTREMVDVIKLSDHLAATQELDEQYSARLAEKDAEVAKHNALHEYATKAVEQLKARIDNQAFIISENTKTIARQAVELADAREMIEKLNSELSAFVEYFDAIKEGEYKKNRPFLRTFEEVLLLRGQEALNEIAGKQKAGAKDE